MSALSVHRESPSVVTVRRDMRIVLTLIGDEELETVADGLALYASISRCGDGLCTGCEVDESQDTEAKP